MLPYDFSKENFTRMGYVTEGVTTYMGDRILFESGVFSRNQYFNELEKLFERHFFIAMAEIIILFQNLVGILG